METDYGSVLANEATMSPASLEAKALHKLVTEFQYLRSHSVHPLTTFLDYITYEYMIDNVMLLLRGTLSGRNVNELMAQCHPLGMFKESTMKSIPTFEASSRGYAELYETVLVDTPVGPYFQRYLDAQATSMSNASEVRNVLEEVQIEILKNSLMKIYLEDFYMFCEKMGGETAEVMCSLLRAKADRYSISITLNSFGTPLNDPAMRETERKKLYPSIGELYPAGIELLSRVDEDSKLVTALSAFPAYRLMFEKFLNSSPGKLIRTLNNSSDINHALTKSPSSPPFVSHLTNRRIFHRRRVLQKRGQAAGACIRITDAPWSLLRLHEAQGTGDSKSRLDFRMHITEAKGPDWPFHPCIFIRFGMAL